MKLPTSDLKLFEHQLNNPNKTFKGEIETKHDIIKIEKNILLAHPSDATGCGHIRCLFPLQYLNCVFGGKGDLVPFISPMFLYQHDILVRTRSILFQRTMSKHQVKNVVEYKNLQRKYNYKMVYDIDDFIWDGNRPGEKIPDYNMASSEIDLETKQTAIEVMKLMDIVCVSTQFLKDYLQKEKGLTNRIEVVNNTVPKFFWQNQGKRGKINKRIEKPRVIYTGSPSHYCNTRKLKGDWDNSWCDWVIEKVKNNEIDLLVCGGLPWFFESIKNKIYCINWLNSYEYHSSIIKFRPDFGISPLVPNYFNYAKSNLKFIEYSAVGAVSIGTTFTNGMPSPYDNNVIKVPDNYTVSQINEVFNMCREPDMFNEIIQTQYKMLDDNGYYTESSKYINKLCSIF